MMICDDCRYSKQALVIDGNGNKRVMLCGCYLEEIPIFYSETGGYECEYFTEESGKIQSAFPDKETYSKKKEEEVN